MEKLEVKVINWYGYSTSNTRIEVVAAGQNTIDPDTEN